MYHCANFGCDRYGTVDNILKFQYLARLAWKRRFPTQKLGFWKCDLLKREQHHRNAKMAHICVSPRRLSHRAWKSSIGLTLSSRWVPAKGIKWLYYSPICLGFASKAPPLYGRICIKFCPVVGVAKFWTAVDVDDVITCNNFWRAVKGLSLIHIWRCRRSTLCRSRWSPYH